MDTKVPIVGDIVWLGRQGNGPIKPVPAIVTEVVNPGDPKSPLKLVSFEGQGTGNIPWAGYSEELADGAWSWPSRSETDRK